MTETPAIIKSVKSIQSFIYSEDTSSIKLILYNLCWSYTSLPTKTNFFHIFPSPHSPDVMHYSLLQFGPMVKIGFLSPVKRPVEIEPPNSDSQGNPWSTEPLW